jgi:DNA-binding transcriptional ArsR family regulator
MADDLDPVIHTTSRLRIMTTLAALPAGDSISFSKLQSVLDMTVGNLSVHLTKLEQAGYVHIEKTFQGRKPATFVRLTGEGRAAFDRYLANLRDLLKDVV